MLIVLVGRPCVGKTTTALQLAAHLQALGKTVIIVNEEAVGIRHADGYKSAACGGNVRDAAM